LDRVPDLERALARLTVGRGGPRDLAAVRDGLMAAGDLAADLTSGAAAPGHGGLAPMPPLARDWIAMLGDHRALTGLLAQALGPDLPLLARDGGFVAKGFDTALDETRSLRDESRRLIAGLERDYREASSVSSLRIKHNNVLGYF